MTEVIPEVIDINKVGDSISIIDINNNSKELSANEITINEVSNSNSQKSGVNFGGGIELLMNEKKKDSNKKDSNIDLEDLNQLENELNELSEPEPKNVLEQSKSGLFNSFFSSSIKLKEDDKQSTTSNDNEPKLQVAFNDNLEKPTTENTKTWDGYSQFNNIPINPDKPEPPKLNKEELLKEKFKYLRKLEALEKKGANLTKKYSMESSLDEMQGEYEMIMAEKEKSNSIKFQAKMLMACITGIEFLNNKFDPFDIKLDGWSEQINENVEDYDEIFAELHEKYKSKAKMAPEIKLLFQLGGSALMIHMTNTMFKSAMPGMDDIMKQNPELMKQFTQAAANTMGESNPGFGGFMNNFMGGLDDIPSNIDIGPPPSPLQTQTMKSKRVPAPQNRPDLNMARDGGISINQTYELSEDNQKSNMRPEMKGPDNITEILSGLKTKQINIQNTDNTSTISIQELKELNNNKMPSRSKRKQKSDKNTVSLDI